MDGKSSTNGINFPIINGKRPNHMALFRQLMKDPASAAKLTGWMDAAGTDTGWKGCVEARPGTLNISDTPPDPSRPDTLFVPYFAPDDPGDGTKPSGSYSNDANYYNNSFIKDTADDAKLARDGGVNILGIDLSGLLGSVVNLVLGGPSKADLDTVAKYVAPQNSSIGTAATTDPNALQLTVGPNRSCPSPIVPLTDDFTKLRKEAGKMLAWAGSGTNVAEGLAWGQRVLSPGAPYTDGTPWKTPGVSKIVMLLTDGENVVYGASNEATKSDYTSYGYLAGSPYGAPGRMADTIELGAVERLVGNAASKISMSSTKSSIGHLLGAAGAAEAIFSILAIRDNVAPATINLDNPERETAIDLVPNKPRARQIDVALSNSFGFGGTNASLVFQRYNG